MSRRPHSNKRQQQRPQFVRRQAAPSLQDMSADKLSNLLRQAKELRTKLPRGFEKLPRSLRDTSNKNTQQIKVRNLFLNGRFPELKQYLITCELLKNRRGPTIQFGKAVHSKRDDNKKDFKTLLIEQIQAIEAQLQAKQGKKAAPDSPKKTTVEDSTAKTSATTSVQLWEDKGEFEKFINAMLQHASPAPSGNDSGSESGDESGSEEKEGKGLSTRVAVAEENNTYTAIIPDSNDKITYNTTNNVITAEGRDPMQLVFNVFIAYAKEHPEERVTWKFVDGGRTAKEIAALKDQYLGGRDNLKARIRFVGEQPLSPRNPGIFGHGNSPEPRPLPHPIILSSQ